ncbi:type VI secretion system baseplate subunit TssG [Enterobacteriaceae bacterium LUAb1]
MEREFQSAHSRLIALLDSHLPETHFYRLCQLLEQVAPERPLLGSTASPADDPVRFRPHPGMGFPVSELKSMNPEDAELPGPPTLRTTFLGLYGVDSPLPSAYIDDIALQREGHEAVTHFLDIFNHRITTQYYRIWRKYSYPATFEAGATDATSQCLLGLTGLGIPGVAAHIATPVSRFLALLSVMRLPTRTCEGVAALVKMLAPKTQASVNPWCPRTLYLTAPASLNRQARISLSGRVVLGKSVQEAGSQLRLTLQTEDKQEAQGWLPGGQLHSDLLALLRVYLGWRSNAILELQLPIRLLPPPQLGRQRVQLGRTGLLGRHNPTAILPDTITVPLGRYQGIAEQLKKKESQHVHYQF